MISVLANRFAYYFAKPGILPGEIMSKFLVVQVDMDYDYLAGLSYVAAFGSEDEANTYIKSRKDEVADSWKKRFEYVDKFMESFEIPSFPPGPTAVKDWEDYKKKLIGFGFSLTPWAMPDRIEFDVRAQLRGRDISLPGFNPPVTLPAVDLAVLEVPE